MALALRVISGFMHYRAALRILAWEIMAMTKSVIIKPVTGDEANHLMRQSDDYMGLLYPAESNHLVDSSALRGEGALYRCLS